MFSNKKSLFFKVLTICLVSIIGLAPAISAQELSDSVLNSLIKEAALNQDSRALAAYFHPKVDLVLLEKRGIYSKDQAQFVISDFFKNYVPDSFEVVSQRESGTSNFVICKLHTPKNHFRVCYLIKEENNKKTIYQFRIEE